MARAHPAHIITDDSAIGGKIIEKSVRCDRASNSYFTRTSDEAGDRRTFTLSGWFKFYRTETSDVDQDFVFYSGTSLNEQFQVSREGNSQINFIDDRPRSTVNLFTNENVKDGLFHYSNNRRDEQFNTIEVAYQDRFDNFNPKLEVVEDEEDISQRGIFKKRVESFGVTSRAMA